MRSFCYPTYLVRKWLEKKIKLNRQFGSNHWVKLGQTETINDNLNPNFTKSFLVDFVFEVKQPIRFEVRDDDGQSSEEIGFVETTIGSLVGAKNQTSILELHTKSTQKSQGKLVVRCDRVSEGCEFFNMKWQGVKLMYNSIDP